MLTTMIRLYFVHCFAFDTVESIQNEFGEKETFFTYLRLLKILI